MTQKKKLVLCLNIGTPKDTKVSSVRSYLNEFLSDKRVLNVPYLMRKLLLHTIILPFRSKKSAEAYRSIWTEEGSPLLLETKKFCLKLEEILGEGYRVLPAMRYGEPSLKGALEKLEGVDELILFPQYPHYASSSTGSSLELAFRLLGRGAIIPPVKVVSSFYKEEGFIKALTERVLTVAGAPNSKSGWEHLLMSYHGLPEDQVMMTESNEERACNRARPCPVDFKTTYCYRKQCYVTSFLLAKELQLEKKDYTVAFQSRLGRKPWIKPYTDEILPEIYASGVRRLAVTCPSFVADCLETLEEISIRLREDWLKLGGKSFTFIPCVNDENSWVEASAKLITK